MSEQPSSESPDFEELTPPWLKRIQENSWEPEIIISSVALAFIFAFPAEIYQFATKLIQEDGMHFVGGMLVMMYLSIVVNVYKIFFVVHLCLRFAWVGLVGVSYAFPHGVIRENLFKFSKDLPYTSSKSLVLKFEQICSMAFGYPLILSIYFLGFTLYLLVLGFVYLTFNLSFGVIYIIFMLTLLLFMALSVSMKSRFQKWYSKSLVGSLGAIYSSNFGKWKTNVYMIVVLTIASLLVIDDAKYLSLYGNAMSFPAEYSDWNESVQYNEASLLEGYRFPRLMIQQSLIEPNFITLYLAYFDEDQKNLSTLDRFYEQEVDSLGFSTNHALGLHKIHLNDSLLTDLIWQPIRLAPNAQRAYVSRLNLESMDSGIHEIRVEKLILFKFLGSKGLLRHRKKWVTAHFLK